MGGGMIYSVTFHTLREEYSVPAYFANNSYKTGAGYQYIRDLAPFINKKVNTFKMLADTIKESEEDSFLFIITNTQIPSFDKWVQKYKLEEFITYRMERAITNGNHTHNGRNLLFVAMCSKTHVWRDMFDESIEWSSV